MHSRSKSPLRRHLPGSARLPSTPLPLLSDSIERRLMSPRRVVPPPVTESPQPSSTSLSRMTIPPPVSIERRLTVSPRRVFSPSDDTDNVLEQLLADKRAVEARLEQGLIYLAGRHSSLEPSKVDALPRLSSATSPNRRMQSPSPTPPDAAGDLHRKAVALLEGRRLRWAAVLDVV